MRAHWYPDLQIQDEYSLTGDSFHRLVHVVRIESGEELLLLSGRGLVVKTVVIVLTKKEIKLKFKSYEDAASRKYEMSLVLGMPKKEALELCLKEAVELGMSQIFLVRSDYSQIKYPDDDRINNLLTSALEQSNAAFMPEVVSASWKTIPWDKFPVILLMDSQLQECPSFFIEKTGPRLLIVGPEGGFSKEELLLLHQLKNVTRLKLPTPILRTPTALAVGAGVLLQSLLD